MYSYIERNRVYVIYLPLFIYWLILFTLTSLPLDRAININVGDKIEHFGAYGLLSFLLYLTLYFQKKSSLLSTFPATFTIVFASFYGMIDELHQLFVPGRYADVLDWVADFSGSLLAVLITQYLLKKIKEIEIDKNKLKAGTFSK